MGCPPHIHMEPPALPHTPPLPATSGLLASLGDLWRHLLSLPNTLDFEVVHQGYAES